MMNNLGQSGQIGSCQIISIMTWCVSQVRSDHYHSHWNSAPICQHYGGLGWHWLQCRNFYHNLKVFWLFSCGDQASAIITIICQHTLYFNFNITHFLYIKLINSCVLTYFTTCWCFIYIRRNTECCLLLAYINWNYFSFHKIISRHKFCGIQSRCKTLYIYIQCYVDTVYIISSRANIGYSVNVIHIYCTIIKSFVNMDSIEVNGGSIYCFTNNYHIYFTYLVWFPFILCCVCAGDNIWGFIQYNFSTSSEDSVFTYVQFHRLSHSNLLSWSQYCTYQISYKLVQIWSCQIISIMTWCVIQVNLVKCILSNLQHSV